MNKVFVYGSLRQGYVNHGLLRLNESASETRFLGLHTIPAGHRMVSLGAFPGVLEADVDNSTPVTGEVYEVNDSVFQRLDWLEGYPNFYNRKVIPTEYGDSWIYFLEDRDGERYDRYPSVASGDWATYYLQNSTSLVGTF